MDNAKTDKIAFPLLFLLIAGYILISPIPFLLNVNSQVVTIPFRAFVALFSMLVIYYYYRNKEHAIKIPTWFILFWLVYLAKMAYDLYVINIRANMFAQKLQYFEYAILICLFPALSVFLVPQNRIDFRKLLNWVYYSLFFILIISIWHIHISGPGTTSGILSMYYISYGHVGATLSFLSLFLLFEKRGKSLPWKILYLIGFTWGLFIIYLAAARSPVLALFIMIALYLFYKIKIKKALIYYTAILIICTIIIFCLNYLLNTHLHNSFFIRTGDMIKGNTNGRWVMYKQALSDFYHHPIFGRSFLLQEGVGMGAYPHNLILEVIMATGLIGLICFGG
ncbi:MAG TPA: O-antigen ligase family protein [Arachidicoccus soli]|nr:O-antigen ligase family protein [Arachidicoccus soli]